MKRIPFLMAVLPVIILLLGSDARAQSEARARYELMKNIRKQKFDLVLPGAMRDNNVDMWIHVMRAGDPDPLELDLGGRGSMSVTDSLTYFIFTDRGGDRIERAVLNGRGDRDLYDIYGSERELRKFVEERDPTVIAVNISDWLPSAGGLSYSGYKRMTRFLGEKYTQRLISSENVVTDFRVRRVQSEIIAFAKIAEFQRELMEETYRRIVPGVTTREELGWWVQDQLMKHNLITLSSGPSAPGGRRGDVYTRGEFLSWDWGLRYLNFGTDYKRNGYILKEGETDIPDGLKLAWERGQKAREILRKTIKVGRTAGETLEAIVRALEAEGYVYTPSADRGSQYRDLLNALGDSEKSGFSIDCHALGNTGNSEVAEGPSIAPFRPGRAHFKVQQNNLFAFEFLVNTWVPEWGRRISINFEDNSIVTEKGVEFLYPVNEKIIVIH